MIKGPLKKSLTSESILALISEYDIYKYYIKDSWQINKVFCSPLRKDSHPSFIIGNKGGNIHFKDFAINDGGNCFNFVEKLFNCNYDEALRRIDNDFGLGFLDNSCKDYKKIISEYKQPEALGKRYSLIQVKIRKFTQNELLYWHNYYQEEEDLKANHIYSIKELYLNKERYTILDSELRFGYLYNNQWWKIYFPNKIKKGKWLSNVPLSTVYGLENLNKEYNTLICKSLKDMLVCKKVYPYVCHVQNESISAFNEETLKYINENSKQVFLGFDSDAPGKQVSMLITNKFNWKHINTPDRLLPFTKDFSEWAKEYGLDKVKKHFKLKKLII